MGRTAARKTSIAILDRIINPDEPSLSPEAAESLLRLALPAGDREPVATLSDKAQEGGVTPDELAELDEYIRVNDLLTVLQRKARLSLKRAGAGMTNGQGD